MKTTLVNLHRYKGTDVVYCDRRSVFGNPFPITATCDRKDSIRSFKERFNRLMANNPYFKQAVELLRGHKLACWCTPLPCHVDIIIEYLENSNEVI